MTNKPDHPPAHIPLSGLNEFELKLHEIKGVKKADLVKWAYYIGHCRNADIAMWDGKVFHYLRTKFNDTFAETLPCPEDADKNHDYFQPFKKVEMK